MKFQIKQSLYNTVKFNEIMKCIDACDIQDISLNLLNYGNMYSIIDQIVLSGKNIPNEIKKELEQSWWKKRNNMIKKEQRIPYLFSCIILYEYFCNHFEIKLV